MLSLSLSLSLNLKKEAYKELYVLRKEEKWNEKIHFINCERMSGLCYLFHGSREKIEKYKEKKKEERDIYVGDCLPRKHSWPL